MRFDIIMSRIIINIHVRGVEFGPLIWRQKRNLETILFEFDSSMFF